ncbi:MAG: dTMP kinase [Actinobacteria bacterium]|nr:dTMP kinase [Actinomycetota bacterium]
MTVPGVFVVLEGGDGAGKSTQLGRLAAWLTQAGREVVVTYEPGDTPLGATVRRLLLDHSSGDVSPRAEAMLYAADKAQHVYEVVRPALDAGKVVGCDRYVDSMIAYQAAGRSLDPDEIRGLADWATGGLAPDLTVVLDVPVERALGEKTDLDRMESAGAEFHARVRAHFLDLAAQDPSRYLVLPGRDDRDAIEAAIRARVEALLP